MKRELVYENPDKTPWLTEGRQEWNLIFDERKDRGKTGDVPDSSDGNDSYGLGIKES